MARTLIKLAGFDVRLKPDHPFRPTTIHQDISDKTALLVKQEMFNSLPSDFRRFINDKENGKDYVSVHHTPDDIPRKYRRVWTTAYALYSSIRSYRNEFKEHYDHWKLNFNERNAQEVKTALSKRDMEWPSHGDFSPHTKIKVQNTEVVYEMNAGYRSKDFWHIEVPVTYAKKTDLNYIPLQWLQRGGKKYACFITDIFDKCRDEESRAIKYGCTFYAFNKHDIDNRSVPRSGTLLIFERDNGDEIIGFGENDKKARSLLNRRLKAETMEALNNAW